MKQVCENESKVITRLGRERFSLPRNPVTQCTPCPEVRTAKGIEKTKTKHEQFVSLSKEIQRTNVTMIDPGSPNSSHFSAGGFKSFGNIGASKDQFVESKDSFTIKIGFEICTRREKMEKTKLIEFSTLILKERCSSSQASFPRRKLSRTPLHLWPLSASLIFTARSQHRWEGN